MGAGNFEKLVAIIECHAGYAHFGCVSDKRDGLARISEDDPVRVNATNGEDLGYFAVGGAVEAGAECCEKAEHVWVGIAFNGYTA
jgi:hypothetical protein